MDLLCERHTESENGLGRKYFQTAEIIGNLARIIYVAAARHTILE